MTMSRFDVWKVPAAGRQLPAPRSLYSDAEDNVYCLDDAGRVLVYTPDGQIRAQWFMPAWDIGRPEGIWKLLDGRIAVADTHYHRIVIFSADLDGKVSHMFGTKGAEAGQFVFPVAVTQDPQGFLYVGEYGDKQRIQKFTVDGTFVAEFGEHGTGDGQFQSPRKVLWKDKTVYIVDAFNNRLQVFSEDGEFLRVLGLPEGADPLKFPYDIKIDDSGRLFVIENKAGRLTILNPDGTIQGRFGRPSRGLEGFFNPWAVAVLKDGRILVADTGNHRLVELTP
ncbi:MAG: hypothetical protein JNL58_03405 [Planctomyces sp.]|nr:hypothetical protein [Planctomyces sp.]